MTSNKLVAPRTAGVDLTARPALALAPMIALLVFGCQAPVDSTETIADEEDEIGAAREAIANGTPVANAENSTMVWLTTPLAWCSASLLTNEWVLTAAHCQPASVAPNTITVGMGNWNNQATQQRTAVFAVHHPSLDFALIKVDKPFTVNGSTTGFKRGFYEGTTGSLTGKQLTGYGYSAGCNGCSDFGTLRSMLVQANGSFDKYNYNYNSVPGNQNVVAGDSGGGGLRTTAAGSFLAGVTKNGGMFQLPENFRDWVTSYIYARPIALPSTWFVYDAIVPISNGARLPAGPFPGSYQSYPPGNVEMWSKPLVNSYDVKGRWWDPCPGSTYTWKATYDFEPYGNGAAPGYDWAEIATKDPLNPNQLKVTHLNGWGGATGTITGKGDIWVDVHTDGSVQSAGIQSMSFRCKSAQEFPSSWASPLPNNTTSTAPPWDPCPGGDAFTWTATYAFQPGDRGEISYTPNPEFPEPVVTQLTGNGTLSGTSYGPTDVSVFTDGANPSTGITSLTAVCSVAIDCQGARCFTLPDALANSAGVGQRRWVAKSWNPCNGGGFSWTAKHNLEPCANCDWGKVGGTQFTGWNGTTSGTASGPVSVEVSTDYSVQSTGFDVTAVCNAWSSSP